ncbi:hypothetical protein D7B24_001924 [Verticillium nonalfalfae]|uniref:Uncharacterized protein n=6 Tax=Verticillium TaxID=1036719 RepID=G2WSC1_VERDV|nr:predicted protein [Verticillium alfalfae VaMs.102]XP_009650126.1 uncharacterized protein VDAG_00454 [Verticillium dahliae VdLs.17]XP_028491560.1 uncharacterized protein D7B24_001924 [Verticillium nonalfalfae]KAF3350572.1 hypothetical protein VdG2_01036 [Verticillium dahliae VDG2]KAF3354395.1 hypothetical protein VdG1_07474 [Verticillium dahliae VDG1]KAH6710239.1 hypothetical protein EV126DRAFT_406890 [Verticillium dahliae]CRK17816.1 hypothetical protein BN1708_003092 [Verticillium longispo
MPEKQTRLTLAMESGIPFVLKAGKARYTCRLQDRSSYQRAKAQRASSSDSINTESTDGNSTSSH